MQVVIVGGSLAGLIHAIVLRKLGHKVHILERLSDDQLRSQAAGLSAGPDVQKFIAEYIKPNAPYAKPVKSVEMVNLGGELVNTIPQPYQMQLSTWSLMYKLFKDQLSRSDGPRVIYETGVNVKSVTKDGVELTVSYAQYEEEIHELQADLVIAADGAHSMLRRTVVADTPPQYVGYVTWRGAVPYEAISQSSREILSDKITFFRTEKGYTISYHVPSETGSMTLGESQFIWIWYEHLEENPQEFEEVFTDTTGKRHSTTVPRGKVDTGVWAKLQDRGTAVSAPFAELIKKTTDPFVSAIRESPPQQGVAHDGKLLFVGDAFSLMRPHTGASTNQAAKQALELAEVLQGRMTFVEWERSAREHATVAGARSVAFGNYCFSGQVPQSLSGTIQAEKRI